MLTGLIASTFTTPIDIVMIRQFAESGKINPGTGLYITGLCAGKRPQHGSTLQTYRTIHALKGWAGLFLGWRVNSLRAALLTTGLAVGYDQTKEMGESSL